LRFSGAVVAFSVLLGTSVASAQGAPDFFPARSLGFAGARSLASSVDAVFLNPAALGQTQQYLLQLDYGHDTAPANETSQPLPTGNGIVVSVLDSKTNPRFPTGLSYRWISLKDTNNKTVAGSIYDFAIAASLFWNISLGLHVAYLSYSNVQTVTGDVGVLIPIGPVNISGVGFNLLQVMDPNAPRGFDAGASLGDNKVYRVGFDFQRNWPYQDPKGPATPPTNLFTVGGEVTIASIVSVRAGLLWNQFAKLNPAQPQFVTAGLGFFYQFIGADVGYRREISTQANVFQFSVKISTG
jgi:hypothetical protein